MREGKGERRVDPAGAAQGPRTLADTMLRLLRSPDPGSLLAAAMDGCLARTGARAGTVYLLQDDGWLRLAKGLGLSEALLATVRLIPPEADLPLVEAIRTRRPVHVRAEEYRSRYPRAHLPPEPTAFSCLPLLVDGRCLGTLTVQLSGTEPLPRSGQRELELIAATCAHRLDHLLAQGAGSEDARLDQALRLLQGRSRAARLELAMANAEIGSFDWDFASGRVIGDERLCRIFGLGPHHFDEGAETFFRAIHPDDRVRVNRLVRESVDTGVYRAQYRIARPDGAERWIDASGKVVPDSHGRPTGMLGVVQDRTEQHAREEGSAARQQFVLDLSRALSEVLSVQAMVEKVFDIVLPGLGGLATALYLREERGLRLAGSRGPGWRESRRPDWLARPDHALPRDPHGEHPLFLGSRAELSRRLPHHGPRPPEGVHAAALLPLTVEGEPVGLWMICYAEPREFTADVQVAHTAAAGLLAQSLARARQFESRRRQLNELQHLMLPRRVPGVPGIETVVRYVPAAEGLYVGGDWYDVLPMPDGRVVLAIGDVQGHSAEAAAVMGQLRTAMRAQANPGPPVGELLALGNRTLCELDTELLATCCLVELDPSRGTLTAVRAGHPPPLLLRPDGRVRELAVPAGLPLGAFADTGYPALTGALAPGELLLLFTDGMRDPPGGGPEETFAELRTALVRWAHGDVPLGTLADRAVASALSHDTHDDLAVLLVHRTG
ncbi:SpoIIE family protein phosphatase [Streptomyces sp. SCSIO ZS0520]|uniref:SpoIIE family protein phosphatase n=1 Tax=Streptomyces sp. SCSIO ZS0520 TaxID=2892996 RepID=UPI0021DB0D14|nr:SpoIIE family protein phosphatase [Streptomyces sp. SCSIO ZS0520]